MKKVLKYGAWALAAILLLALAAWFWAHQVTMGRYEKQWTVHKAEFPIPFPLKADEVPAGADPQAVALERAVKRGHAPGESSRRLQRLPRERLRRRAPSSTSRWSLIGWRPNLTSGEGSVTKGFTANDWDRAVRHGVRHNGQTSSMPSQDFANLTDHELSDIVAYLRSVPPVNRDIGPVKFGPVFEFLIATDPKAFLAFDMDHDKPHVVEPPGRGAQCRTRPAHRAGLPRLPRPQFVRRQARRRSRHADRRAISRRTKPASRGGARATSSARCVKASARTARPSTR